jgi:predicted DNA-binding transcriptional regulator YafY
MRADRLLSLIMLLDIRGKMTASQLAKDLEVSERTIYRDLTALNSSGIPIYTESGPNGGVSLVESYRTNLTGLNLDEVQALSMLGIPEPLVKLGFGQALHAALLKLSAALPSRSRDIEAHARQRIHLDSSWWFQSEHPLPYLQVIYQALWQDRKLRLVYRSAFDAEIEAVTAPYGLVAKASIWYLVGFMNGRIRVLQVSKIIDAAPLEETFVRTLDFDLGKFWKNWCKEYEKKQSLYNVKARISPEIIAHLPRVFGDLAATILAGAGSPDAKGCFIVTIPFENIWTARSRILSLGNAAEVIEPIPLRLSVMDFASQIVKLYEENEVDKHDKNPCPQITS